MRLVVILLICILNAFFLDAKKIRPSSTIAAELYSNIGRKLAEVKKIAPQVAPKISSVLDDVDRLKAAADSVSNQDRVLMSELETRTLESSVLEKELIATKQENDALKQSLQDLQIKVVVLTKDLERERAQLVVLKEQNAQLQRKESSQADLISAEISKIDKQLKASEKPKQAARLLEEERVIRPEKIFLPIERSQNLSLTSTSDPSSPR